MGTFLVVLLIIAMIFSLLGVIIGIIGRDHRRLEFLGAFMSAAAIILYFIFGVIYLIALLV